MMPLSVTVTVSIRAGAAGAKAGHVAHHLGLGVDAAAGR